MRSNDLRGGIRKRTALLFLGGAGSVVVSALVSLLIVLICLFARIRGLPGSSGSGEWLWYRFLIACGLLAAAFLIYGAMNFRKFLLPHGDEDGLFFREDESNLDYSQFPVERIVFFSPYMFFLGLRLCGQGLFLLITPVDESERLLRTLGALGRTDVGTLAEQSGISRKRVLTLLTVLDATIHTKNREVALTTAWSELL